MVTLDNKHTATAKVGKDIIENAEYLTFEHMSTETKEKSFKDKLEYLWLDICHPFRKVRWWIRDIYWQVYYAFERMFKGYDSVDVFELFSTFTERHEKILTQYIKYNCGYPSNMTEDEWDEILTQMLYHLHWMQENNVEEALQKGMPEDWIPSSITVYEIMERHKDEFFKLFSKYFYNLWY